MNKVIAFKMVNTVYPEEISLFIQELNYGPENDIISATYTDTKGFAQKFEVKKGNEIITKLYTVEDDFTNAKLK